MWVRSPPSAPMPVYKLIPVPGLFASLVRLFVIQGQGSICVRKSSGLVARSRVTPASPKNSVPSVPTSGPFAAPCNKSSTGISSATLLLLTQLLSVLHPPVESKRLACRCGFLHPSLLQRWITFRQRFPQAQRTAACATTQIVFQQDLFELRTR